MAIKYVTGDATDPVGDGPKVICHITNDSGYWGSGFVVPLGAKYPQAKAEYAAAFPKGQYQMDKLGTVQFVTIKDGELYVANMCAQRSIKPCKDYTPDGCPPIRYNALLKCLKEVAAFVQQKKASVHGPRFGAGLSGGDWETIEALIEKAMGSVPVTIYDFQPAAAPAAAVPATPVPDPFGG